MSVLIAWHDDDDDNDDDDFSTYVDIFLNFSPSSKTKVHWMKSGRFYGLVWFVGFYGISTFVGYLTPNPFLCK